MKRWYFLILSLLIVETFALQFGQDAWSGSWGHTVNPIPGTTLYKTKKGDSSASSSKDVTVQFNARIPFGPFILMHAFGDEELYNILGEDFKGNSRDDLKNNLITMLRSAHPLKKLQLDAILYSASMYGNKNLKQVVLNEVNERISRQSNHCELSDDYWNFLNFVLPSDLEVGNQIVQKQIDVKNCILNTDYENARQVPRSPKDPFTNLVSHCLKLNQMPYQCFHLKSLMLLEKMKEGNLKCINNPFQLVENSQENHFYIQEFGNELSTTAVGIKLGAGKKVYSHIRYNGIGCSEGGNDCKEEIGRYSDLEDEGRFNCDDQYIMLNGIGISGSFSNFFTSTHSKESLIYGLKRREGKGIEEANDNKTDESSASSQ